MFDRQRINNGIKKFFGGNWGKPRDFQQRATEIPDDFFDDKEGRWYSKKKKGPKKTIAFWGMCPFCLGPLEELPEAERTLFRDYIGECACGAIKVPDCPACHRDTWLKDKVYKHQWLGCGFEGERRNGPSGNKENNHMS